MDTVRKLETYLHHVSFRENLKVLMQHANLSEDSIKTFELQIKEADRQADIWWKDLMGIKVVW